jgi:hypothetical protein
LCRISEGCAYKPRLVKKVCDGFLSWGCKRAFSNYENRLGREFVRRAFLHRAKFLWMDVCKERLQRIV